MKKLLIILYEDFPWYSGLSERVWGIIKQLAAHDINTMIFAPLFSNYRKLAAVEGKVERIRLCKFKRKYVLTKLLSFISWVYFQVRCFFKILKNSRSIVAIQYEHYYAFPLAYIVKILLKKPIIADDINLLSIRPFPIIQRKIFHVIERLILEKSSLVTTASPITYVYTKAYFPKTRMIYMPNAINEVPVLKNYHMNKWIVFIGNLHFKQNVEAVKMIFKITAELAKTRNDFKVIIVGANADKARDFLSKSLIEKRIVEFLGTIPEEVLNDILNRSAIALLPFFDLPRWGGQMTKTLKLMSYGICVVASPEAVKWIGGVKPGDHYILVKSLKDATKALNTLLSDLERCREIGLKARKFIVSKYVYNKVYARYLHLVKKIVVNDH